MKLSPERSDIVGNIFSIHFSIRVVNGTIKRVQKNIIDRVLVVIMMFD